MTLSNVYKIRIKSPFLAAIKADLELKDADPADLVLKETNVEEFGSAPVLVCSSFPVLWMNDACHMKKQWLGLKIHKFPILLVCTVNRDQLQSSSSSRHRIAASCHRITTVSPMCDTAAIRRIICCLSHRHCITMLI